MLVITAVWQPAGQSHVHSNSLDRCWKPITQTQRQHGVGVMDVLGCLKSIGITSEW